MESTALVVTVHCPACGSTYSKPAGSGTVRTNPGCPKCGYLGWSREGHLRDTLGRTRFDAGLLRDRLVRTR